jgi:hypothetical protein
MPGTSEFPPDKCRNCVGFTQLSCIAARSALGAVADELFESGAVQNHILDPTEREKRERAARRFRELGCVHAAIIQHREEPAARSEELE